MKKRKRTFTERITQLGNIACIESCLMKQRNQHGIMPRTKKAKRILKTYEKNVFGRELDVCVRDKNVSDNERHTNAEWQGKE